MSLKSDYFKMGKDEFNKYINNLKESKATISFLNNNFFYYPTIDLSNKILDLNKKINEFDFIINTFSGFTKKQIIQSFLIDEIDSTNRIENIHSTRHDIFQVINNVSSSNDKKIISISNAYRKLIESNGSSIKELKDIREIYDIVLKNAIEKKDLPDGLYFRKGDVYISNGFMNIHTGTIGEEKINSAMDDFLKLYNSNNELITKMILCHFVFEYIHPFYDGNGRLGRFLFSNGLYQESKSLFSFAISASFEHEKEKYYKAFKKASDKYEFGCLNGYFEIIIDILVDQISILINKLKKEKEALLSHTSTIKLSKTEQKIYNLLCEASIFSLFGLSKEEIMNEINVSRRSIIYCLDKMREEKILIDTKLGRRTYHKILMK